MKKLLFILTLFVAVSAKANTADTLKVDTVQFAIQVQPYVINALKKDTVWQVKTERIWLTPHDTTGAGTYIVYYDRKRNKVGEDNIQIPYSVVKVWLDDSVIDDYILTYLGLYRRY